MGLRDWLPGTDYDSVHDLKAVQGRINGLLANPTDDSFTMAVGVMRNAMGDSGSHLQAEIYGLGTEGGTSPFKNEKIVDQNLGVLKPMIGQFITAATSGKVSPEVAYNGLKGLEDSYNANSNNNYAGSIYYGYRAASGIEDGYNIRGALDTAIKPLTPAPQPHSLHCLQTIQAAQDQITPLLATPNDNAFRQSCEIATKGIMDSWGALESDQRGDVNDSYTYYPDGNADYHITEKSYTSFTADHITKLMAAQENLVKKLIAASATVSPDIAAKELTALKLKLQQGNGSQQPEGLNYWVQPRKNQQTFLNEFDISGDLDKAIAQSQTRVQGPANAGKALQAVVDSLAPGNPAVDFDTLARQARDAMLLASGYMQAAGANQTMAPMLQTQTAIVVDNLLDAAADAGRKGEDSQVIAAKLKEVFAAGDLLIEQDPTALDAIKQYNQRAAGMGRNK
jgi:hypothetical protein